MVLFRDEETKREKTKLEKRFWLAFKILLTLFLLFIFGLWMLSAMGGSNDAFKKGLEDYLSQMSGSRAVISRFGEMHFFPELSLTAGQITFEKNVPGEPPAAAIGAVHFSSGFWQVMRSRIRLRSLEIHEAYAERGFLGPYALTIRTAMLDTPADSPPSLLARGTVDGTAFDLRAEMARHIGSGYFYLPDDGKIDLSFGDLALSGKGTWRRNLFTVDFSLTGAEGDVTPGHFMQKRGILHNELAAELRPGDSVFTLSREYGGAGKEAVMRLHTQKAACADWMPVGRLLRTLAAILASAESGRKYEIMFAAEAFGPEAQAAGGIIRLEDGKAILPDAFPCPAGNADEKE